MRKPIFNTLKAFGACALLAASCLSAQTGHTIIVNVPFDFVVMNKHMVAGTYDVTTDILTTTVVIRGEDNGSAALALTRSAQAGKAQEQAKLVFKRYGDRYFLAEVWHAGTDQGRVLGTSKIEQELARNTGKREIIALLASGLRQHKPIR